VLNSLRSVDHAVRDTTRFVRGAELVASELLKVLRSELENNESVDALSVTYPNGEFVELRHPDEQFGGYQGYVVHYGDGTVATRIETDYDADLNAVSERSSGLAFGTTRTEAYLAAIATFALAWSGPVADAVSGHDVVRASLATRDPKGTVTMVVAADLAIGPLQESLSTLPTGSDGAIFVLASDGAVIAAPGQRTIVPVAERQAAEGDVVAPQQQPSNDVDEALAELGSGGDDTTVVRSLDDHGVDWVVEVRASAAGLNGGFGRLRETLNLVTGGLIILTVVLGYVLVRMWRPMMDLRHGAERDALTGLYNRRHVDAAAESMLRFADRTEARAAFVMMDLDDFKSVNDDLGHGEGDRALRTVGAHVMQEIRAGDLAARWGGDEFLLVLLLVPDDDAEGVVERIRAGTSDALAALFPGRFDLGVTAGFATTDVVGDDVGVLIASADRALVRGKGVAKGYTYALAPHT